MSRSYRREAHYRAHSATPGKGKRQTSRTLRHKARREAEKLATHIEDPDFDPDFFLDDPRDVKRGIAGSRSPDWGWDYFGDGREVTSYEKKGRK